MAQEAAQLLPAYVLVGTDELKVSRAVSRLKSYVAPGYEIFDLEELEANAELTPENLLFSLNTFPVGDGRRVVVLNGGSSLAKALSEALVGYLAQPNPGCTLCLVVEKLARNTRLYKAIAACGKNAVIDCAPLKRWELPRSVVQLGQRYGVSIDFDAAEELVARAGESTSMLDAQVRTLAALCAGTHHVTRSDVEAHVAQTAEVKPWVFLDALCARDAARALSLLQLMGKTSEVGLCFMIAGRVRELICARALGARGGSQADVARELKKQDWQVKNHMGWARRFSEQELRAALISCAACERALKSGADGSAVLSSLVIEICGAA